MKMMRDLPRNVAAALALFVASAMLATMASAQTASTIEAPVTTGFGVYTPLTVAAIRPESGLSEPTVSANFSNVATAGPRFPWNNFFSQSERTLLERNNFVVRPEPFGSFAEAYNKSSSSQEVGSFVTVDAIMHGLRVTVDESQRKLERDYMTPALESVLGTLARTLSGQMLTERDPKIVSALGRVLGYVETGRALVEPRSDINSRVRDAVQAEVGRIRSASGVASSSVFPGRRIDYGAFAPTGHYKLNEAFGNYYRARTWLSTVGLSLRDADGDLDADEARMSVLLARAIDAASSSDGMFSEKYLDLFELSAFFAGRSESDITWDMLAGAVNGYFGKMIGGASGAMAVDSTMLDLARFAEAQLPHISTNGVRELRLLPVTASRGLVDRMSDARSRVAPSTAIGAAMFASVGAADPRSAETLRRTFATRVKEDWVQSLEWTLLYTMQPLVAENDDASGYPRFARSDAWRAMRTAGALGAWADFQHPVASMPLKSIRVGSAREAASGDLQTPGYVEPIPEGWARVSSLAGYLRDGLTSKRYGTAVGRDIEARLRDIESASAVMMQIATAELSGRELSSAQLELIASMKSRIAAYESFSDRSLSDGAPIVAGVATSRTNGAAPATGHPLVVYVIVPRNDGVGGLMLTRGAVYSYYEVESNPDEWLTAMTSGTRDIQPSKWMNSYLASDRPFALDAGKFQAIEGSLPPSIAYMPSKEEKKQRLLTADLEMESNTVRSSEGELWYTVRAPELNGADIIVTVLNTSGREVYRTTPARIEAGKRYDMIRVEGLQPGQYFIRVTDYADRTLASGRFMVVR